MPKIISLGLKEKSQSTDSNSMNNEMESSLFKKTTYSTTEELLEAFEDEMQASDLVESIKRNPKIVKTIRFEDPEAEAAIYRDDERVPDGLKIEKVESFFQALEKRTISISGKKIKILDRSDFPWVFATKILAGYVAHILRDKMGVACAFPNIEKVAGYNPKSPLRSYYHNNCDRNRGIPDSNIVDDAYDDCKKHKFKLVE